MRRRTKLIKMTDGTEKKIKTCPLKSNVPIPDRPLQVQAVGTCSVARKGRPTPPGFESECPAAVMQMGPIETRGDYAKALKFVMDTYGLRPRRSSRLAKKARDKGLFKK